MNSSDALDLKQPRSQLREAGRIIGYRLTDHLKDALAARPKVDDYAKDEDLFRPFARAYITDTITFEYTSLYLEIGRRLAEKVDQHEKKHGVTVKQNPVASSTIRLASTAE